MKVSDEYTITLEKLIKVVHTYSDPIRIKVVMGDAGMKFDEPMRGTGWAMHKYSTDGRVEISLKCTLPLIDIEKTTEEAA